jgi:uncharacterized membrane protein
MSATATKLPQSTRPLIQDMDLAAAIERMLEPLTGKSLERAQAACRRVYNAGNPGTFDAMCAEYRAAIDAAVGKDKET